MSKNRLMAEYYKILGVRESASNNEIKQAYRKLSTKFHPDKNGGDVFFENMFKQIQEAFDTLGNPEKKRIYDRSRQTNTTSNSSGNFLPVVETFSTNSNQFYSGDYIEFTWRTFNADHVELKPFGEVPHSGSKTFRVNNINKEFLDVTLYATNTEIGKVATASIRMENKLFADARRTPGSHNFRRQEKKDFKNRKNPNRFKKNNQRITRKTFAIRSVLTTLMGAILIAANGGSALGNLLGLAIIITLMIISIPRIKDYEGNIWLILFYLVPGLNFILWVILLTSKGTEGQNIYGPDPRREKT